MPPVSAKQPVPMPAAMPPPLEFLVAKENSSIGKNPTDLQQFWKFCNQETWHREKLLHQKELADTFDEIKKN